MKLRPSKQLVVTALVLAAIALVAADEAQASNMAFKMNKAIVGPNIRNFVSLPYRNPLTTAENLCDALNLPQVVGPPRATVTQYNTLAGGTPSVHTCGDAGPFALFLRLGVEISSPAAASGIIVGSHIPGAFVYALTDFAGFPDGYNVLTIPYHTTATILPNICTQAGLPGNGPAAGADSTVTRINAVGTPVQYTCGDAVGPGLELFLGEAVEVLTPLTTPTISTFSPPHF